MIAPIAMGAGAAVLANMLKSKGSSYDKGQIVQGVNNSANRQNTIATNLTPTLGKLNDPYKAERLGSADAAQAEGRASSEKFLNDIGDSSDKLGENLSGALMRRTMQGSQQQAQQLREQLASTGGMQNGSATAAFQGLGAQTANNLYEGNNNIINQTLQARQDAMGKAYDMDQGMISDKLGISQDVLAELYASGREDLISEANSLLGIEANRSTQEQGAQVGYANANLAKESAQRQSNNALLASLMNMGGQVMGSKQKSTDVRGNTAEK